MFRTKSLAFSTAPGISAKQNSNEYYRHYNFQAFANISGNIKFTENLQSYMVSIENRPVK